MDLTELCISVWNQTFRLWKATELGESTTVTRPVTDQQDNIEDRDSHTDPDSQAEVDPEPATSATSPDSHAMSEDLSPFPSPANPRWMASHHRTQVQKL
jgi:hypothetical protein